MNDANTEQINLTFTSVFTLQNTPAVSNLLCASILPLSPVNRGIRFCPSLLRKCLTPSQTEVLFFCGALLFLIRCFQSIFCLKWHLPPLSTELAGRVVIQGQKGKGHGYLRCSYSWEQSCCLTATFTSQEWFNQMWIVFSALWNWFSQCMLVLKSYVYLVSKFKSEPSWVFVRRRAGKKTGATHWLDLTVAKTKRTQGAAVNCWISACVSFLCVFGGGVVIFFSLL